MAWYLTPPSQLFNSVLASPAPPLWKALTKGKGKKKSDDHNVGSNSADMIMADGRNVFGKVVHQFESMKAATTELLDMNLRPFPVAGTFKVPTLDKSRYDIHGSTQTYVEASQDLTTSTTDLQKLAFETKRKLEEAPLRPEEKQILFGEIVKWETLVHMLPLEKYPHEQVKSDSVGFIPSIGKNQLEDWLKVTKENIATLVEVDTQTPPPFAPSTSPFSSSSAGGSTSPKSDWSYHPSPQNLYGDPIDQVQIQFDDGLNLNYGSPLMWDGEGYMALRDSRDHDYHRDHQATATSHQRPARQRRGQDEYHSSASVFRGGPRYTH